MREPPFQLFALFLAIVFLTNFPIISSFRFLLQKNSTSLPPLFSAAFSHFLFFSLSLFLSHALTDSLTPLLMRVCTYTHTHTFTHSHTHSHREHTTTQHNKSFTISLTTTQTQFLTPHPFIQLYTHTYLSIDMAKLSLTHSLTQ